MATNSIPPTTARPRRVVVKQLTASCLSCAHGTVKVENEGLKVFCAKRHTSAVACPDAQEDGRAELMHAIVSRVRRTQTGYRKVFNVVQPDCPNCKENCCTRPFLPKTPFYGEDQIYYLLIGQPLPSIPKGVDHCIFFNQGCTLPSHLRPHVCIEYKCPFTPQPPEIDTLGERMTQDTIYLITVATKDMNWRGTYPQKDEHGRRTRRVVDRFKREWNPSDPLGDLREKYGV